MRRLVFRAASQLRGKPSGDRVHRLQNSGSSGCLQALHKSVKHSFETFSLQRSPGLRVLADSQPFSTSLREQDQPGRNGNAPSIYSGAQPRSAEPVTEPGLPTNPPYLASRTVSQAVHEHFHRSSSGPFPCSLSNSLPRPTAQSASKSGCKPELNLWEHGPPFCDISVPPFGLNPDRLAEPPLVSGNPDATPWRESVLRRASFGSLIGAKALGFWTGTEGTALKQGVQIRCFRSLPSGSILLAEESEGSEVTVADQEVEVVSGKKKYGPRRSQRLPRSIIGSYGDDFEDELDLAEPSPWQGILYDIRPKVDQFMIDEMGANPPLDLEDLVDEAEELGMISEIPDEYAGLPLVLRWETRFVLAPGPTAHHPLNRKVKLQAYLRDLGLSRNARERMIALVGPRFNRGKDEVTLVSQRYPQREENRKDVLRILYALIDESKRADTEGEEMAAAA